MCGITGIISQSPLSPEFYHRLRLMNQAMSHRGPDGSGEFVADHVALAMRRLSIIDLVGGKQPLYNEDNSLVLVCNGEIYNYIELQQFLSKKGHHFKTASDCEVILHLYEEYGTNCLNYLRGMFAFALWDIGRNRLLIARDRMGEKPIYLFRSPGVLIFASELKSLLKSGLVRFQLDPVSIYQYFHYAYVPEPRTPLTDVFKLKPGHFLVVDVNKWDFEQKCYWQMEDIPPLSGNPTQLILEQLTEISEQIVRSDVPIGIALSSGLDSSVAAAMAARAYSGEVHAFSVGYPGNLPGDERAKARLWAETLGIVFHDIEIHIEDMVSSFPELNFWRDDPIADIAGYCYFLVMKLARECGVPVVMQGQGVDELFWGYPWLRKSVTQSLLKLKTQNEGWLALPSVVGSWLTQISSFRGFLGSARRGFGIPKGNQKFYEYLCHDSDQLVFYDMHPDFQEAVNASVGQYLEFESDISWVVSLFSQSKPWDDIPVVITRLICETYLLQNGLAQGDRLSMASSVELRLPFVDYRLVETIIGIRKNNDDHTIPPKELFKKAVSNLVPDYILNQPKRSFSPPVSAWYNALFKCYSGDILDGYLVQNNVLNPSGAMEFAQGKYPLGTFMPLSFKALVLETWCRQMSGIC